MEVVFEDDNLLKYIQSFLGDADLLAPSMVSRLWRVCILQHERKTSDWSVSRTFRTAISQGQKSLIDFCIEIRALRNSEKPAVWAIRSENIKLVERLAKLGYPLLSGAYAAASSIGSVEMLELLDRCGGTCSSPESAMRAATKKGHVCVLKWFEEKFPEINWVESWKRLAVVAIRMGQTEVFDYLFDGACMRRDIVLSEALFAKNFEVAERFWRFNDKSRIDLDPYIARNNLEAIRWLCDTKGVIPTSDNVLTALESHDILKYFLVGKRMDLPQGVFDEALGCTENADTFRLLIARGFVPSGEDFVEAVRYRNVAALTALKENNCPYSVPSVMENVEETAFALHRWLRDNGFHFPLSERQLKLALDHMATTHLGYLLKNECPYNPENFTEEEKKIIKRCC
ncbi:hypothetical protein [Brazilian marseillevirus]|uniref:hypothetical protein n=1 Tax=Brazilian marseillevirus TaxID=1813599 RepID=UPI000784FEF9|nr:hypothetical protein A3303_gp125 [Brazilian marseillevirus]AMQ10633.1 hypothetical protein [Brazilian marseillevirus]